MSQGRGSAAQGSALLLVLALFFVIVAVQMDGVRSASYVVGGAGGWTFNVVGWPNGKRFRVGDELVFKYDASIHNVVAVNGGGYNGCTTPGGSKVYNSGYDRIRLVKGQNFFICSFTGHCSSGMKIAITAT